MQPAATADAFEIVAGEVPPERTLVVAHDIHPAARRPLIDSERNEVECIRDALGTG